MSDDDTECGTCDGRGEIDVTTIEEYGCLPCPACISREKREALAAERERIAKWLDANGQPGLAVEIRHMK